MYTLFSRVKLITMNFPVIIIIIDGIVTCSGAELRGESRGSAPGAPTPTPLKLEKQMICWRKIVIFYTKYPNNFRASLRSEQFFKFAPPPPPNFKSWICLWNSLFLRKPTKHR